MIKTPVKYLGVQYEKKKPRTIVIITVCAVTSDTKLDNRLIPWEGIGKQILSPFIYLNTLLDRFMQTH